MNHDTDIPAQAAKLLFRLWQNAPETDEDGERIRPKDYVELAIHAALRGEGQYSTSTIKRRLSAENEITAPTKLPVGPLIVRWEPNNYQDGYHAPKWEVNGWLQDAEQLLHRLEICPAEAAKLTAQGMDERELVERLRRNVPSALVEKAELAIALACARRQPKPGLGYQPGTQGGPGRARALGERGC